MKREKLTFSDDDEFFRNIFGDKCPEAFKSKTGEIKSAPSYDPNKEVVSKPKSPAKRSRHSASDPKGKNLEEMDYSFINPNILGIEDENPTSAKGAGVMPDSVDSAKNNTASEPMPAETTEVNIATMATKVNEVTKAGEKDDEGSSVEEVARSSESANPPPVKATRVSAKMRKASRQEFHDTYLVKTDTKGGAPITIALDVIQMAQRICLSSGSMKAKPTYLINNLLREFFKEIEGDIAEWSRLV